MPGLTNGLNNTTSPVIEGVVTDAIRGNYTQFYKVSDAIRDRLQTLYGSSWIVAVNPAEAPYYVSWVMSGDFVYVVIRVDAIDITLYHNKSLLLL